MKTLFKSVLAVMLIAMLFGACDLGKDEDTRENSDVNWTSIDTNPAIKVRNNTSEALVAFKGELLKEYILGGIPANAKNHGFAKGGLLGSKSEDFPMILIKEADYNANKSNLKILQDKPFTRIYVFYNGQGENTNIYDISDRLGGDFKLVVQNPTKYNVELRLGGVNGETIGYAPGGMLATTLYVTEGDFNIFPVFKRYNAVRDILETLYPQADNGYSWFKPLGFDASAGIKEKTFSITDAVTALNAKSALGAAWLAIDNQTSGAVHLIIGDSVVRSATGVSYFSGSKTFLLEMSNVSVSGGSVQYSADRTFANLKVGPDAFEVPIKTKENGSTTLVLKSDMMYQVTVTGDHNSLEGLTALIELREEGDNLTGKPTKITLDW